MQCEQRMSQRSVDPLAVIRRLVLTISFLAGPLLCPAHAADAVVPGDFSTIQAAIDAVINGTLPDGASIEVQPGIYQEALSISSTGKSFTVRGTAGAPVTIVDAAGGVFQIPAGKPAVALCRCGQSKNKPYCDGSHRSAGFRSDP